MNYPAAFAKVCVASAAFMAFVCADATVVLSNMPSNDGTQSALLNNDRRKAMSFTTDNEDWFLDSATLRLNANENSTPLLNLHADLAGLPGAVLATFVNPASFGTGNADYVFTSGAVVTANTKYWLVLYDPSGATPFDWKASSPAVTPTGLWEHTGSLFTTNAGGTWSNSAILNSYELQATIVPEPATMGALALGLGALLARRRKTKA